MSEQNPLRIGILTAGAHPVQTIYLPALHALPTLYSITAIYFSRPQEPAVPVPANSISTANTTQDPDTILSDPDIDLILNFMPNEYHELYTIAALQAGKHVMVETPVSLSIPSARRIIEAEKDAPNGARVFVASARRYAPCFEDVFKREVRSLERIHYARCRTIAGPHIAHTVTSSRVGAGNAESDGVGPGSNGVVLPMKEKEAGEDRTKRLRGLMEEVFGKDEQLSQERMALSRFLASLGCHDLGLMRDTLGYPDAISNISVNEPFYSALFHYNGAAVDGAHPYPFTLTYEAGTDCVPRCDAQLAVYGHTKTVTIYYDLPYARGQPVRVVVEAADERGGLMQTETVSTWEEAYQEELRALHAHLVEGKTAKTTARDSLEDIKLFQAIFEQYDRQCGTIRTPLG
ncbi:Gfo/Idh/MocA family protein [Aspergillus lucknowensis]|uniref:Gfo/Idh/MocA-like oxidoreductase N-terminal domain-containing protein n=1 Tax=Aspergillus lucknowensis TaxID=176173 RepID=A0ABR4M314_9EURO